MPPGTCRLQLIHADAERGFIDFTRVGLCSSVKGKKGDMTFDVPSVKMKGEAKAGDKVRVRKKGSWPRLLVIGA